MEDLKAYREQHKLSCADFGKLVGVTRVTVFRWEDGTRRIDLSLVPKITQITGIPRERLRPDVFGDAA